MSTQYKASYAQPPVRQALVATRHAAPPADLRDTLSDAIDRLILIRDGLQENVQDVALAFARLLYAERRLRDRMLGTVPFEEPCWDMLLDLFIAREEGRETAISNACVASNVPSTTALRYLRALEMTGAVERTHSTHDGRVKLVALTGRMHALMRDLLIRMLVMRESGLGWAGGGSGALMPHGHRHAASS